MKLRKIIALLCAAALLTAGLSLSVCAEVEQTVLFSGEKVISGSWGFGPVIETTNGGGSFDPTEITVGGWFSVTYRGTEGAVYLSFARTTNSIWAKLKTPTDTVANADGTYTSTFSYADCAGALGSEDFSTVKSICVGSGDAVGETVILEVSWNGDPEALNADGSLTLYSGSVTAAARNTHMAFVFTAHVGGTWDAGRINEGSWLRADYFGAENGIYLAFASFSGATNWVAVYADETGVNEDGSFYSIFRYENFAKAFGTNFVKLDQIQIYSATSSAVTLTGLYYFAGTGERVDSGDATWEKPDSGIAFIGDSIVHNPLCDTSHLGGIDWNGILGRTDCVNYGIGGQTTRECAARIGELAQKHYEKLVILCGINDIGRNYSNAVIAANYTAIIEAMQASNPDIEIFIISVLPTEPVYYTNAQDKIVALNDTLRALADEMRGVQFVDCYSSFVDTETQYCREGLTFDGLHPNLDGYAIIAEILTPYLNGEIEDSSPIPTAPAETQPQQTDDGNSNGFPIAIAAAVFLAAAAIGVVLWKKRAGKK